MKYDKRMRSMKKEGELNGVKEEGFDKERVFSWKSKLRRSMIKRRRK